MSYPKTKVFTILPTNARIAALAWLSIWKEESLTISFRALEICVNLDHRGGCGCDPITGDGAGIFIQKPHKFFVLLDDHSITLPNEGDYGVGFFYLSKLTEQYDLEVSVIKAVLDELRLELCSSETSQSKVQFWVKLRQLANRECNSFSSASARLRQRFGFWKKALSCKENDFYRSDIHLQY